MLINVGRDDSPQVHKRADIPRRYAGVAQLSVAINTKPVADGKKYKTVINDRHA